MWEEAGVKVWDVRYHSGQPWVSPFTSTKCDTNLMHTSDLAVPRKSDGGLLRYRRRHPAHTHGPRQRARRSAPPPSCRPLTLTLTPVPDAQWFTREQILAILSHPDGTNIAKRDYKVLNEIQDGPAAEQAKQDQEGAAALAHSDPSIAAKEVKVLVEEPGAPSFRVPPVTAIAGVLIRQWAEGTIQANAVLQKGNL